MLHLLKSEIFHWDIILIVNTLGKTGITNLRTYAQVQNPGMLYSQDQIP